MKKTIRQLCMVALMALCALPALAQLNGTGFYRFRNAARPTEYISMTNDKFNYWSIIDDAGGGLEPLANESAAQQRSVTCSIRFLQNDIHMVEDSDIIDLASVIYAKEITTDNEYNLIGQGTSLLTLTTGIYKGTYTLAIFPVPITLNFENLYVSLRPVDVDELNKTRYTASMALKASNFSQADLGIRYFVDEGGKFDNDEYNSPEATPIKARWYIEPVNHFNVQPEVEYNGKYYTTLKVPFAVNLSGSVEKAYAITAISDGVIAYREITGTISAGTPVLLQCSSPNAADCRIIPMGEPVYTAPQETAHTSTTGVPAATDVIAPTTDNLLIGTYYCNTDGTLTYPKANGTGTIDGNHYQSTNGKYELGITADGKFGFVPAQGITTPQNIQAMPANKAWMTNGGLFPTVATPTITPTSGTYTEAQTVTITAENDAAIEYSTDGGITWQTYSNPITLDETMIVKARAIKQGLYNNSEVITAEYVIEIPDIHKPGDVNHDGAVNVKDVTDLIDYLLDIDNGICTICADVKEDGAINISDVTKLIDMLLGI